MPEFLETLLRGGAVTTFLLLAVLLLRDGRDRTPARLGALFCASTGWWALNTEPFVSWSLVWASPIWACEARHNPLGASSATARIGAI